MVEDTRKKEVIWLTQASGKLRSLAVVLFVKVSQSVDPTYCV